MEVSNNSFDLDFESNNTNVNLSSKVVTDNSITTFVPSSTNTLSYQTVNTQNTNVVEEVDLSLDETENKSFFSEVGDWFANLGREIYDTGAKVVEDVGSWISDRIEDLKGIGATLAETACNVASNVSSLLGSFASWVTKTALPAVGEALVKTGASIGNTITGLLQGVGQFGEALVDTAAIIGTGIASAVTGLIDLGQWAVGKITGNENWHSLTKDMWSRTMEFVQKEHVNEAFKKFHEDSALGKWLDDNAYAPFKSDGMVYQIANGVGYIAGIIALTIVTMGAGGAAVGASSVGATAASGTAINLGSLATIEVTKQSIVSGIIAATAGFGKNTEAAWNDGADLLEGMGYGLAKGSWEGLEMLLGASINSLKLADLGVGAVGQQLATTGCHVALDTLDGASANFIDPLMQMIYNPNETNMEDIMRIVNFDENGNQISNKTWDDLTFSEKYDALFKYNGGWTGVMTAAASAGAMSFLSEIPDIRKAVKGTSTIETIAAATAGGAVAKSADGGEVAASTAKSVDANEASATAASEMLDQVETDSAVASAAKSVNADGASVYGYKSIDDIRAEVNSSYQIQSIGFLDDDLSKINFVEYKPEFTLKQISNASIEDQINYINYSSYEDILSFFSAWNSRFTDSFNYFKDKDLNPMVLDALFERIIKEQDILFTDCLLSDFSFYGLTSIADNQYLLSKLSTENLSVLASKYSGPLPSNLVDELIKRINNDEMIFATSGTDNFYMMMTSNPIESSIDSISENNPELFEKMIELFKNNRSGVVSDEIRQIVGWSNIPLCKCLLMGELLNNDCFDEASIAIMKKIQDINPSMFKAVDFRMLDKDIIKDFGEDFIVNYSRFGNITNKIFALKSTYPKVYDAYVVMMKNASMDDSLGLMDIKVKDTLEFLYNNAKKFDNIDHIDLVELQEFIDMNGLNGNSLNIDFSNKFREELALSLDLNVSQLDLSLPSSLTELKEAYFNKYFSMSLETAEDMYNKYSTNLDQLLIDPNCREAAIALQKLHEIAECDDVFVLKELYDEQNYRFTAEDMLHIDSTIQQGYTSSYVTALAETGEKLSVSKVDMVPIEGTNLTAPVITLDDNKDFSFLVYSSDTGFNPHSKNLPDNFVEDFSRLDSGQTHGISTSFITSDNIGSAPVLDAGVLYGFTNIDDILIREMGSQDISSRIVSMGFSSSVKQQYIMADEMSQHTLRLYNEFVLDRDGLKPNCIILFSDASEDVKMNSLKAAAEWSAMGEVVPVVKIDVEKLAMSQIDNVNSNLLAFKSTGDISKLRDAIIGYESGASGFNLNVIGDIDSKHCNIHKSALDIYRSCNLEQECINYAQELVRSGTDSQKQEFRSILEDIKKMYSNTRSENMVKSLAETNSMLDIDAMLNLLGG